MCVCACTNVCVCVCMYVYAQLSAICMYACMMYVCTYVCRNVQMRTRLACIASSRADPRTATRMNVCMHVWIYTFACMHA